MDLDKTVAELEGYTGNVWTLIISLKREDAARLGYDSARAWQSLLRAHRNNIAAAMKIPPNDFRWYAAFHDEGEHPHVHMMAWSVKPGQAYLSKEGIRQIKSKLTDDIFKQEMLHLYEQKSASRDELVREARQAMLELTQSMAQGICNHPNAERLMQELAEQLGTVKGKKTYGYLPRAQKKLVDEIVGQMERLPVVRACYGKWLELQDSVDAYYHDTPRERIPLSGQKEFQAVKNAVIREAERIRLGEISFEESGIRREDEPESDGQAPRSYWNLKDTIYDDGIPLEERHTAVQELGNLAESGNPYAQYLMGKLWRDGPLPTPDWVNARHWFERAAQQGHIVAQYALGKLYLSDDVEVRAPAEGLRWLETAAQNGSHYAAYRLGKEYLKGEVAEKDVPKALEYLSRSAGAGNQFAQYMLGKLYLTGREVKYDKELAIYWLTQSANQGNEYAKFFLERQENFRPPSVMLSATRLLHHMGRIFQKNALPKSRPGGIQIDRKRLKKLREKKMTQGHKADDHEEQNWTMSM